jgi:hypothetical protein
MNTFVVLATILAAASAGLVAPLTTIQKIGHGPSQLVRAPAHDSASIESHRLGGNFAYSTAEAHAFAQITPEISEATHPVAETTYVHQPAPIAHVQPAPIVKTHHAAHPIFGQQAILAQEPVVGPIATHTHVEQALFKQQHVNVHQPAPVPIIAEGYAHAAPLGYAHHGLAAPLGYAHGPHGIIA